MKNAKEVKEVKVVDQSESELPEVKDLVLFEESEIVGIFDQEGGLEALFDRLKNSVLPIVHDVNDPKSRDQIKSLAYSVSRSKTAVENHGKELSAKIKEKSKVIDEKRKFWKDSCDKLRDQVREPLTNWENEQQAKIDFVKAKIDAVRDYSVINSGMKSQEIAKNISIVKEMEFTEEEYGDLLSEVKLVKYESIELLEASLEKAKASEAEEEKRIESLKADAIKEFEEKARLREEALIIERDRAVENERQRAENERKSQERADAARTKDIEHRKRINNEILSSICATGMLDEDQAKTFIRLIHSGEIKNIKIIY